MPALNRRELEVARKRASAPPTNSTTPRKAAETPGQLPGAGSRKTPAQLQATTRSGQRQGRPEGGRAPSAVRRALCRLDRKRRRLKTKFNESLNKHWRDLEPDHNQAGHNYSSSVGTLDLFKFASLRERAAVGLGVLFMWYAASWQPISVFILATMAALMGQYSRQAAWIQQLRVPPAANSSRGLGASATLRGIPVPLPAAGQAACAPAPYEGLAVLAPVGSLVAPIFDMAAATPTTLALEASLDGSPANYNASTGADVQAAVQDILGHESRRFLRKSFEINGAAFLLALSQLAAFFLGMSLITWSARRQAARLKVLYFRSCLHQEVSWFESAADSASGSGSSLSALVGRYEDGVGVKLALLCYFLGHVGLFALTAFWQMVRLAAFCMPFVLVVGLTIAYLSEFQALAIGRHSLFAKRSLQLAEEIISAVRTVFAFNGQQKEMARFSISLQPVYKRSLVKHLYTALTTSLSKFSIFACFAAYCFYAMRLFPPYDEQPKLDKATVLAVLRGAEVSIVNVLISIPFMEALQEARGSIGRVYAAIERRSKISAANERGQKPPDDQWSPSISFRQVQFGYMERANGDQSAASGRRSSLLASSLFGTLDRQAPLASAQAAAGGQPDGAAAPTSTAAEASDRRRRSLIDQLAEAAAKFEDKQRLATLTHEHSLVAGGQGANKAAATIRRMLGRELGDAQSRGEHSVLAKFNLEIKAGQSVALVGPSGSGKSTVLALVQRLYETTGGQLLIGQHDIKDLSVAWLRNQIGIVAQEPRLFDMTISENIRLGLVEDVDSATSEENGKHRENLDTGSSGSPPARGRIAREASIAQQVVEAAQAAGAHEFIVRLPAGYETRVGSAGLQLSGGQKQRIAIARALIRRPKILLLDECTSALDPDSEAQVQEALRAASKGRTVLTVAHRLATIRQVDLIVVMSRGQVVECGSHEELMARSVGQHCSCIYKQMFEEQQREADRRPPSKRAPTASAASAAGDRKSPTGNPLARVSFSNVNSADDSDSDKGQSSSGREAKASMGSDLSVDDDDEYDDDIYHGDASSTAKRSPSAWQLWQFIEMPKWCSLAACLVCLIAGLILPINLIAHSYLFSAFAYEELEQIGDYLRAFGLVMLSFSSLVFVVSFLQILLPGYVGEKLSVRLRVKTMDSLLSKPMFYFDMDSNSSGAICDRFNSYISSIQGIAGARVATMLEAISTLAAGAFFGFGQNMPLSSFCLSFALLVLLTTIIESRIVQREYSMQQKFDAQLAHLMADALSNIKTIASLNKETFFVERFSSIIEQRELGIGRWLGWLRTFLTSIKFVMPAMSWSAGMYYGSYLLVNDRIDLQTVFIVCPVVLFAVNDTFRALVFLPELLEARDALARLFIMCREFSPEVMQTLSLGQQLEQQRQLHLEQLAAEAEAVATKGERRGTLGAARDQGSRRRSEKSVSFIGIPDQQKQVPTGSPLSISQINNVDNQEGATPIPRKSVDRRLSGLPSYMRRKSSRLNSLVPSSRARGRIEFRDVEFVYPNRPNALVLDGFSMSVAPGESVALVGGSGSGKSTCVAILEKFYDYHAGHVSVDGADLRLVASGWVRSQVGLVSQEPTLLSYSIADNIRYGDNGRFVGMDEVIAAARTANIHDFIMSLPEQYDTELTGGSSDYQLSGGQRQRIAIARALVSRAPILVFDEATSALDARNETIVLDALNKAKRGRTSLTIAHRLASVRDADKIVVMKAGKVVEVGRHEDLLLREGGHYRRLWERQEGRHNLPT